VAKFHIQLADLWREEQECMHVVHLDCKMASGKLCTNAIPSVLKIAGIYTVGF
jgi:hypothetical protein